MNRALDSSSFPSMPGMNRCAGLQFKQKRTEYTKYIKVEGRGRKSLLETHAR